MNDGSTVMQLPRQLVKADSEVWTAADALNVGLEPVESASVEVTVVGGLLRRAPCGTDSTGEDELASFHLNTAVLEVSGMDRRGDTTMHDPVDRVFARRIIDRAGRMIVVAQFELGGWRLRPRHRLRRDRRARD